MWHWLPTLQHHRDWYHARHRLSGATGRTGQNSYVDINSVRSAAESEQARQHQGKHDRKPKCLLSFPFDCGVFGVLVRILHGLSPDLIRPFRFQSRRLNFRPI